MNGIHNQHEEHCLDIEVLIAAYTKGIFPMAESQFEEKIFWVEPKYRGVIPLDNFHSSRSLERHIRRYNSVVKYNKDFDLILNGCAKREQTWINPILKDTYKLLYEKGYAHSVGVFENNKLVGGLFGISINGAFFGESMYSNTPNASKIEEVYISDIPNSGTIRAGHKHHRLEEFFVILDGSAKFVLVDDRKESTTYKKRATFFLNGEFRSALFVPSEIFHVFITLENNSKCLAIASDAYDAQNPDMIPATKDVFENEFDI